MFRQPRVHAWLAGVEGIEPLNVGVERLRVKHRSASDDVARAACGALKRRTWTSWVIQGFEEAVEERGRHASLRLVLTQDLFCTVFGCRADKIADREVDQVSGEGDLGFAFRADPDFETSCSCHRDSLCVRINVREYLPTVNTTPGPLHDRCVSAGGSRYGTTKSIFVPGRNGDRTHRSRYPVSGTMGC